MIDIQNEALQLKEESKKQTGKKRKLSEALPDDEDESSEEDVTIQADIDLSAGGEDDEEDEELVPMPQSEGIEALRKKLHDRMAQLRNRGRPIYEAGDRDALLEERRGQRAAMRERRRKERKEKIKREAEMRGKKKNKDKREEKQKGNATKVCRHVSSVNTADPQMTTYS